MRKVKQKRSERKLLVALCASLLFVGACGSVEAMTPNFLQEALSNNKEIAEGQAFYEQLEAENAANGEQKEGEADTKEEQQVEQIDTTGKVKVTFAENSLLNVSYYSDAELTKKIEKENCYLEPEACIYASVPESKTGTSSKYKFDGFRVYEFDKNGEKKLKETILPLEDKLVYKITAVTEGDGIAIVPVGAYEKRVITLSDYVVNANGEKQELANGTWKVNNNKCTEEEVEINPLTSYGVIYEYEGDDYYFVSATPEEICHYPTEKGNADGKVSFRIQESESTASHFSVELHKYLSVTIDNSAKGLNSIKIGNEEIDVKKETSKEFSCGAVVEIKNNEVMVKRLKCGDSLIITTDKDYKLYTTKEQFENLEKKGNVFEYTYKVPETAITGTDSDNIEFNVREWAVKNVVIKKDNKQDLSWWEELVGTDEPLVTIKTTGDVDTTYKKLKNDDKILLKEYEKMEITVNNKIPEGFQVNIVINDADETFKVKSGSEELRKEYNYDEVSNVRITILDTREEGVDKITKLKVALEKSLKNNADILFSLDASGERKVSGQEYIKKDEILFEGDVDAKKELVLSARNIQLYDGTALKITIKGNNEVKEIRYCDSNTMEEIISLIKSNEGGITEYYGVMDISIGLVDVDTYRTRTGSNYTVSVYFADEKSELKDGDIVEGSRKVLLTITAANGYYIAGDKYIENNTVYQREMEYSDYVEQIDTILSKNPVKKFITASVDVSAPYQAGTVTVIVNGKVRITETDTYWFMEGDEIKFTLELNKDSGYYIVGEGPLEKDLNGKRTETIVVTPKMEGTVISVGDCIEVKKEN